MKSVRIAAAVLIVCLLWGCAEPAIAQPPYVDLNAIPAWDGEPYFVIDDNTPGFTEDDLTKHSFAHYSSLDLLGRCGTASACITRSMLSDKEREPLNTVTPTGWINRKYDLIDGNYLYHRCHLLAFQLTGSNADERNLVTGTRYMNVQGMLPFENRVADHVRENRHHVLYRVTPLFRDLELVCRGIQMEAYCVDCGNEDPFMFHVFFYNVQPGIEIDYATGQSNPLRIDEDAQVKTYILNISSKKFHDPSCSSAAAISDKNREEVTCTRDELIYRGYDPCGSCKP